jgi:hypothetical protein
MKIIKHLNSEWFRYVFETLAIIVGILVAFSMDNWNENRKDRIIEIEILTEIRENLIQDFEDHNDNIGYLNNCVRSSRIVLEHLNNDLPYHDSLESHFSWLITVVNFDAVTSGYELWLSEGINIMTNDSIRLTISKVYGEQYKSLSGWLKDRQYNNSQPLFNDMMKKFKTFESWNRAIPRNYEELKDDDDFKVLVQQNAYIIYLTIDYYEDILDGLKHLIDDLEHEIERLRE